MFLYIKNNYALFRRKKYKLNFLLWPNFSKQFVGQMRSRIFRPFLGAVPPPPLPPPDRCDLNKMVSKNGFPGYSCLPPSPTSYLESDSPYHPHNMADVAKLNKTLLLPQKGGGVVSTGDNMHNMEF